MYAPKTNKEKLPCKKCGIIPGIIYEQSALSPITVKFSHLCYSCEDDRYKQIIKERK